MVGSDEFPFGEGLLTGANGKGSALQLETLNELKTLMEAGENHGFLDPKY